MIKKFFILVVLFSCFYSSEEEPDFKLPEVEIIGEEKRIISDSKKENIPPFERSLSSEIPYLITGEPFYKITLLKKERPLIKKIKLGNQITEIIGQYGSFDTLGLEVLTGTGKEKYSYLANLYSKKSNGFIEDYAYKEFYGDCIWQFSRGENIFLNFLVFSRQEQIPKNTEGEINKITLNTKITIDENLFKNNILRIFLSYEFSKYNREYDNKRLNEFEVPTVHRFEASSYFKMIWFKSNMLKINLDFIAENHLKEEVCNLTKILIETLLPQSTLEDLEINLGLICDFEWKEKTKPFIMPKTEMVYFPLSKLKVKFGFEPNLSFFSFKELYIISNNYVEPAEILPKQIEYSNLNLEMFYKTNPNSELYTAIFLRHFENYIIWQDRDENNLFAPEIWPLVDGIEVKAGIKYKITEDLSQETYYGFYKAKNRKEKALVVPSIPSHILSSNFYYKIADFNFFVEGNYIGKLFLEKGNYTPEKKQRSVDDYFIVNLGGSKNITQLDKAKITLKLNNLFNKKYKNKFGLSEPGINTLLEVNFKF